MQRRNGYLWALLAFAFVTVLGFHGRARQVAIADRNPTSAPSISKEFVESAALCELLLLQLHGYTHLLPPTPVSL